MTEGSPRKGSLYQPANAKKHPMSLQEQQPEMDEECGPNFPSSVSFPGLFDHIVIPLELELLT